jgi:hypothetical protein
MTVHCRRVLGRLPALPLQPDAGGSVPALRCGASRARSLRGIVRAVRSRSALAHFLRASTARVCPTRACAGRAAARLAPPVVGGGGRRRGPDRGPVARAPWRRIAGFASPRRARAHGGVDRSLRPVARIDFQVTRRKSAPTRLEGDLARQRPGGGNRSGATRPDRPGTGWRRSGLSHGPRRRAPPVGGRLRARFGFARERGRPVARLPGTARLDSRAAPPLETDRGRRKGLGARAVSARRVPRDRLPDPGRNQRVRVPVVRVLLARLRSRTGNRPAVARHPPRAGGLAPRISGPHLGSLGRGRLPEARASRHPPRGPRQGPPTASSFCVRRRRAMLARPPSTSSRPAPEESFQGIAAR